MKAVLRSFRLCCADKRELFNRMTYIVERSILSYTLLGCRIERFRDNECIIERPNDENYFLFV